jgi:hypothetical protein
MQRDKGRNFQAKIAKFINDHYPDTLYAENTGIAQAGQNSTLPDVTIHAGNGMTITAELKHHANYPKRLWDELADNDVLIVKRTAKPGEPAYPELAVLLLTDYLELIGGSK